MNIIEIKDLVIDYGIVRAVKGVNLNVKKGTIVALLGANGAGKTSLIRSVSGATKVKSGEILFNGQDIKNIDPYKIAGMGVKQSPEGRMILNGLTVEENLLVGAYTVPKKEFQSYYKVYILIFLDFKKEESNKHLPYQVVSNKCFQLVEHLWENLKYCY
nr:ATP-binding cassette domain-containing protein [Acholeplasma laidlawii]